MTTNPTEDLENIKKEAYEICQEFLGDTWSELPISEFKFSTISGGFSNSLYRCALPDNFVTENPKTPRQALLRIYGFIQQELNAVVTESAIFTLLAERNLGPKLYGVFPKGRLEEYIPSRILLSKDFKTMYPAIARELAKIHSLDVPVRKTPDFWIVLVKKWLNDVETETREKKNCSFEYLDLYTEAIEWFPREMEKSNSPVVYCHNDLHGGNILFREDSPSEEEPRLTLIDFELGAYNYRGFELANQFNEWCFQYNTSEYPHFEYNDKNFPSKEEQISYIKAYLDQLVEEGVIPPTSVENEIQVILQEIDLFRMASNVIWSLWCWKMTFQPNENFGYKEHAMTRLNAFRSFMPSYTNDKIH